jgi:replicative DNA helicase
MRSVLGAMMLDPNAAAIGLSELRHDAMGAAPEGRALAAVRAIYGRGQPIDMVGVVRELEVSKMLDQAGGPGGVSGLLEYACPLLTLERNCRIVNEEAIERALRTTCLTVVAELPERPIEESLDSAEARIAAIRDSHSTIEFEPLGAIVARVFSGATQGLKTGYRLFDWMTGGMSPGRLVTVGARTGVGKTAIATQIALRLAREQVPVLFFSLEMATSEIVERLISLIGMVPIGKVRSGSWRPAATSAARELVNLPIQLVHVPRPTVVDLRATIRRSKPPPALVVVDYLQLVHPAERCDSRAEAVDRAVAGLKAMAMEFGVPVLALAQVNRNTEDRGKIREPMLSDLRESGGIEMHSDVVAFLHREKYYEPGDTEAKLIVAKNRQGPRRNEKLTFTGVYARFDSVEHAPVEPEATFAFDDDVPPPAE